VQIEADSLWEKNVNKKVLQFHSVATTLATTRATRASEFEAASPAQVVAAIVEQRLERHLQTASMIGFFGSRCATQNWQPLLPWHEEHDEVNCAQHLSSAQAAAADEPLGTVVVTATVDEPTSLALDEATVVEF
jgi:hypothetical protein